MREHAADKTSRTPCNRVQVLRQGDTACLRLAGDWSIQRDSADADAALQALRAGSARAVVFEASELTGWDSSLITFLLKTLAQCRERGLSVDTAGLPQGVQRLLGLATAIPERSGARKTLKREPFLSSVGSQTLALLDAGRDMLTFLGEVTVALGRLATGRARFPKAEFFAILKTCGSEALPIVSLISLLVGLILAFVGAVQLSMFGAQIFVASLVAIAMVRVMGAIMTGIIMAGRTGAAFAAEIGTMQVNEEIDALQTMGVSPMEFLVLPRMLALVIMMPLLCVYADLMGILGGFIVGVGMLDLTVTEYYQETVRSISLTNLWIGLFHGAVFGVIVALAGCMRGMQCGRSASAVGTATTSAVVTSIISIVIATAIITIVCNVLGI
ncbi:MAG: STAS domain-containing protein [Deltaproteobacteria bacterium]|nr:STAS domain-containing protein [Deltaproteobacteria bacterium]